MSSSFRVIPFAALAILIASAACRQQDVEKHSTPAAGSAPGRQAPASSAATPPQGPPATVPSWNGFKPEAGPVLVGHAVKLSDMTETEQKYGMAPKRGAGVVYQDQVVLMEHGDKAVKTWNTNGIEWTLDGSDPQVNTLQEGQILFATSRCVGRVLKLTRTGSDVTVILGPVQLTDLIKQGNLTYEEPLDLNTLTAVQTPDFPGAFGSPIADQMKKAQPGSDAGSDVRYYIVSPAGKWRPMRTIRRAADAQLALWDDGDAPRPPVFRASYSPGQLPDVFFNDELTAAPCWLDCGGLGLRMTATRDGVTVKIAVIFHVREPRLRFGAGIYNGSIAGWVALTGAAGFDMTMEGLSDQGFSANINQTGAIPVDLLLPLGIAGVPIEAHFHQNVSLATGFSAKTSVLQAHANFDVSGNLTLQYEGGKFTVPPMKAKLINSLSGDVNGVSMGINSVVFAIDQQLLVGVGVAGFATGPYVSLTSSITALKQASEAGTMTMMNAPVADCRQGTFLMSINGGIGYAIPKFVATVVNFFLGLVKAKPIEPSGSLIRLPSPVKLLDLRSQMPPDCAGK
jgi:hypothetical protein